MKQNFYKIVREGLYGGSLRQEQVEGTEAILKASEGLPVSHRAYLLATTYHETDKTMQPITEYGGVKYFDKYDTGKLAKQLGNTPAKDGDGFKFRGRGYVMITGLRNYTVASKALGVDFVNNPELVKDPQHAADILVRGCTEGWFTGKKLSDYLPHDYVNARRVVNGVDDAELIAGYARVYERALAEIETQKTPSAETGELPYQWLVDLIKKVFGR